MNDLLKIGSFLAISKYENDMRSVEMGMVAVLEST